MDHCRKEKELDADKSNETTKAYDAHPLEVTSAESKSVLLHGEDKPYEATEAIPVGSIFALSTVAFAIDFGYK